MFFLFLNIFNITFIMPDVKPIDEIKYDFKQNKHEGVRLEVENQLYLYQ